MAETLIVLLIVLVVLSLASSAILNARVAARRSQCSSNFRQLSLAVHLYELENRVLPPGVTNQGGPINDRVPGLHQGLFAKLLPHLDREDFASAIDQERSVYDAANWTVRGRRLNVLVCPGDSLGVPSATILGVVSSYAGCHHDVEAPIDADNHGVFFLNSRVSIAEIGDGTACTIFLGEKRTPPGDLGWMSGTRATLRNTGTRINATDRDGTPAPPPGLYVGGFGSGHPGGSIFAFGDGSAPVPDRVDRPGGLPTPRPPR